MLSAVCIAVVTAIVDARQRRMMSDGGASTRSVLVYNGAPTPRPVASLFSLWEAMYPGHIYAVRMVRDTGALSDQLDCAFRLSAAMRRLEMELAEERGRPNSDAHMHASPAAHAKREARCAALDIELDRLREEHEMTLASAEERRAAVDVPENDRGCCYFVLFRTCAAASVAQQVRNTATMRGVVAAPEPHEVNWDALRPAAVRKAPTKALLVTALFFGVLFFYSVPITFVSSLMVLDELERKSAVLALVLCWLGPFVRGLLAAFLPTLALLLFLSLLPVGLRALAMRKGHPDLADAEIEAILNLWLFNFVWVLLGTSIVSAILGEALAFHRTLLIGWGPMAPLLPPRFLLTLPALESLCHDSRPIARGHRLSRVRCLHLLHDLSQPRSMRLPSL